MKAELTINAAAEGRAAGDLFRFQPILFSLVVAIALLSPLLGLFLTGWIGVVVGIAVNISALILGLKAVTLIVRRTHFRFFTPKPTPRPAGPDGAFGSLSVA